MLRTVLAGVGLVAIVGVSAMAIKADYYADDDSRPSLRVSFAGLDLATVQGEVELERRITGAIKRVCPPSSRPTPLREASLWQKCRDDAWASTRPQVAVAIDVARHRGQGGMAGPAYAPPLGAVIEQARWDSFQSGQPSRWRDGQGRGVVVVSPPPLWRGRMP